MQLRAEHLVRHEAPPPRRRALLIRMQPLLQRPAAAGLHDPEPAVVALDERPAALRRPPDPPGQGVVHVEPREHRLLEVHNAEPVDHLAGREVVHGSQVVELHDEVHAGELVHGGAAGHVAGHDRREPVAGDRRLVVGAHGLAADENEAVADEN